MSDGFTHAAWTDALADGVLLGGACRACGTTVGTPKAACPDCVPGGSTRSNSRRRASSTPKRRSTSRRRESRSVATRWPSSTSGRRALGRLDEAGVEIGESVALAGYVEDEQGYAAPRFEAV
jgi:hypothetical protein